jgi:hypothetical protein
VAGPSIGDSNALPSRAVGTVFGVFPFRVAAPSERLTM